MSYSEFEVETKGGETGGPVPEADRKVRESEDQLGSLMGREGGTRLCVVRSVRKVCESMLGGLSVLCADGQVYRWRCRGPKPEALG